MPQLTLAEVEALRRAAAGPVSFRSDGERLTAAQDWMMCATTYRAMIYHHWIPEVIS